MALRDRWSTRSDGTAATFQDRHDGPLPAGTDCGAVVAPRGARVIASRDSVVLGHVPGSTISVSTGGDAWQSALVPAGPALAAPTAGTRKGLGG